MARKIPGIPDKARGVKGNAPNANSVPALRNQVTLLAEDVEALKAALGLHQPIAGGGAGASLAQATRPNVKTKRPAKS